ncbi:hypothetical protein ACYF6T_42010 [Streptomyces sp. 7R007]
MAVGARVLSDLLRLPADVGAPLVVESDHDQVAVPRQATAVVMAAVTGDRPELEGDVGPRGPTSAVQAAVPFHPPTDFLQIDAHMPDGCRVFNSAFGLTDCHSDARSPEALLLGCTIMACPGKVVAANPLTYIGERHTPPSLIFHGEQDPLCRTTRAACSTTPSRPRVKRHI